MANADFRFVLHHLSAGKTLTHWGQIQELLSVAVDGEGRPLLSSVTSVLNSHGRLRGDTVQIASYVRLDKDQDVAANIST